MKALSTIQPWATLQIIGAKRFETRSWSTQYRGTLAVHASVKNPFWGIHTFDPEAFSHLYHALREVGLLPEYILQTTALNFMPSVLPTGNVLGTVDLVAVHSITPEFRAQLTKRELAFGDYTVGRYAWELANPVAFDRPIPAKGAQGLWNWEDPK